MEERWREPAALAEQYAGMLYRLAYARTGSRADAEDVMQEVFVRLLRARPEFRDEEHAKAWLLRVAANLSKNRLSYWKRHPQEELSDLLPGESEDPALAAVWDCVKALPPRYRAVIHLYYYEQYSTGEIAGLLGKKESTVRSLLARGRALLRDIWEEDENGD